MIELWGMWCLPNKPCEEIMLNKYDNGEKCQLTRDEFNAGATGEYFRGEHVTFYCKDGNS